MIVFIVDTTFGQHKINKVVVEVTAKQFLPVQKGAPSALRVSWLKVKEKDKDPLMEAMGSKRRWWARFLAAFKQNLSVTYLSRHTALAKFSRRSDH